MFVHLQKVVEKTTSFVGIKKQGKRRQLAELGLHQAEKGEAASDVK